MPLPGQGHFTWVDGRSYEGAYNNDQKDGFGTSGGPAGPQEVSGGESYAS